MAIKDRSRLDDHYSRQARREGYPARSVYKLEEMDRKYRLFRPGQKVLDLGCAPGSWSLYAAGRVGEGGRVLGLDLKSPAGRRPSPPQLIFIQADILAAAPDMVRAWGPFDLVLSDLAPATTGRREVDQARSLELARAARDWAWALLKPGGHLVFKIFQSPEEAVFIRELQNKFKEINLLKPKATRCSSQEIFGLGLFFRPGTS
ncbi:ribosomal RNA large subunit methyltransferase E [Deltaproteobacteria bacterium]|nr:ribosomal RNA large subunit methyltransferase E [Deltaproteobacteria bacterium]